jgi:sn-glycerol 3-phosphate transport system permease protein
MALIEIAAPRPALAPARPVQTARTEGRAARATGSVVGHVVLTVISILSIGPVVWMYLTSLRPNSAAFSPDLLSAFTGENYAKVWNQLDVPGLFFNTLAMAVGISLGQLITSLLAAYAFARWNFRGQSVLFFLVIASWLVPFQVTMLPNYVLLSQLGLLNTVAGVIVPQLSSAYAVILLRQHFKSFPKELFDAAQIDGRGSWATLWRVVVPNMAPSIAALGILLFISSWNEYFWPFLVFRDASKSVLQLAIQPFLGTESLDYGALMAVSGLACLPVLAIYLIFQRHVVNAFVRSGLK